MKALTAEAGSKFAETVGIAVDDEAGTITYTLVDSLPYPNVGCCWDVEHAAICHQDQRKALALVGKRLKATHISDYNSVKNDHILPYMGLVDWQEVMDALRIADYQGDFTYEIHNYTANMPEAGIQTALAHSIAIGNHLLSL